MSQPPICLSPDLPNPFPTKPLFEYFSSSAGQPEYIHPYLVESSETSLSICYPRQFAEPTYTYQTFFEDLTISSVNADDSTRRRRVSSPTDLSVTLDLPSSNLRFILARGCPFVTCEVIGTGSVSLSISTVHKITDFFSCNESQNKYVIKLDNNQTWILYSFSPINLRPGLPITSDNFSGIIRIALLPDSSNSFCEEVLDLCASCYPVSGRAQIKDPFYLEYNWETKGQGNLLMLAHPLHRRLLSPSESQIPPLEDFKYKSMDGELVGVIGNSWVLKTDRLPVKWLSFTEGIEEKSYGEIQDALRKDVKAMCGEKISTESPKIYGVLLARVARLALIAKEVCYSSVVPTIGKFLKDNIKLRFDGNFVGGKNDAPQSIAGYYIYAIAVLANIDPDWGTKYRAQAYWFMAEFMNAGPRYFDYWKLHSWVRAGGENAFYHDRTSEALNAYYSVALMGSAYKDDVMVNNALTLSALEICSAKTWWHVREEDDLYVEKFVENNRMVSIVSSNMRESAIFSYPPTRTANWIKFSLGDHVLPVLPITEALFSDVRYVRELVKWALTVLPRESVQDEYMEVVSALEGIYDKEAALKKIRKLKQFNYSNSCTNLLWWVHSRGDTPFPFAHFPSTSGSKKYTYEELHEATKEFSYRNLLGSGAYGSVYKGTLAGKEVAIKQMRVQEDSDFGNEVKIISRIQHPNLVSLLGYCKYKQKRLLVYEYVPNKTLREHLHGGDRGVMNWENRVKVALGAACGIEYLHKDRGGQIIHRDIKSDNILLDEDFNAKVADFGFARFASKAEAIETRRVTGTPGYLAPEYAMNVNLTEKVDVYSFGVVLLELITGREPLAASKISLADWAKPYLWKPVNDEILRTFVDGNLENNFVKSEMARMIETAADCVRYTAEERPAMSEVVSALRRVG